MITQEKINECVSKFNVGLYLQAKGIRYRNTNTGLFFCSPLRHENNPSAVIFHGSKIYRDFATKETMSIVNFVCQLEGCNFARAIEIISGERFQDLAQVQSSAVKYDENPKYTYTELTTPKLFEYTRSRGISDETAKQYLRECIIKGKFHHVAFKNDGGGYAIRNTSNSKTFTLRWINDGRSRPTTINNNSDKVVIFEGTFDFLAWLEYMKFIGKDSGRFDAIVLNTVANWKYANLRDYAQIYLYLDNDGKTEAGQRESEAIMAEYPDKVTNLTPTTFAPYGCKDFNDFWRQKIGIK
ncbi:MAG: toprim domain-containing protein [Bacteroidales bacterium]|nr:toprim domain-containing protein [Bacteroidales bacterium]